MSLTLTAGTASVLAQLLEFLAGLPSTPDIIRGEARDRAGSIEEALPPVRPQPQPGARSRDGVVVLANATATAVAGLLEHLAELPSTPPAVKDEARDHAQRLWTELARPADDA